jgi:hypothetical protein
MGLSYSEMVKILDQARGELLGESSPTTWEVEKVIATLTAQRTALGRLNQISCECAGPTTCENCRIVESVLAVTGFRKNPGDEKTAPEGRQTKTG